MHTRLSSPSRLRACQLAALGLPLLQFAVCAQTPAPQTPPSDTVEMSPFTVSSDSVRGYGASETMTGSRVKTEIADLPYTVNVLTSEFFEDFGIFEFSDNITQIGSFTGLDIGGNFNLRGFSSSYQLRDGFFRLGRYGSSNIDRMEIIKGSNAAIYGRTSPGGMINMISKAPKDSASQKLSFNYGDFGTERVTLEATGPLFKELLGQSRYILTASHYQREFDQAYAINRNQEYYLAVDHVFRDGSKLFLSAEFFSQLRHAPLGVVPLVVDQKGTSVTTDDVAVGYALNLGKHNPFGPRSELNRANTAVSAIFDKQLNSVFSARVSGNLYKARRWDYNQNTGWGTINIHPASATTPIRSSRGATPNRTRIFEDGGGFQADLLAHYWSNHRSIEHRTLLTLDFNDYYRYDPTLSYGSSSNPDIVAWNAVRTVVLDADYNPVAPVQYFQKWYDQSTGEVLTRDRKYRTTVLGGLLRQQSALFGGRLLAFAGGRFDAVRYRHTEYLTPIPGYTLGSLIGRTVTAFKPNMGVNYKLRPNFRFFANYSQSYFLSQADTPAIVADPGFKPEVADGWDYGFKGSLFGDRLNYTVSGFYINRENVTVTDRVETPVGSGNYLDVSRRDGNQLVRGFEVDVNWLITEELSLLGSFGKVNSIYTDFGSSFPAAVGRKVPFITPENGSLSLKYTPARGLLKGFSFNVGVTHMGATPTELPNAGDTYASTGPRVVTSSTGQWRLRAPSYSLWSLGLRYQLPLGGKLSHSIAINLNNAFDKSYLRVGSSSNNRLLGEHRAVYLTYSIGHRGSLF